MLARILDRSNLQPPTGRRLALIVAIGAAALVAATLIVALLESPVVGLGDASPVYFGAIVLVGSLIGTWPAIASAVIAFLVYDLLFTQPRFTLLVEDPREWLDLVVFLVIAVVVGRLSALGTERAGEASRRAAEATDLFAISRLLATAGDAETAAPEVIQRLVDSGGVERSWLVRDRPGGGGPRVVADTDPGAALPASPIVQSLVRMPGDTPAHWVRSHEPGGRASGQRPGTIVVRVKLEADGVAVGALKASLPPGRREPDKTTTRLLSLAADQLALAIRRDDLRREATELEIARRADTLKGALLDAVSHDLRTPLASIRAAAGSLTDPDVAIDPASARSTAAAIDLEAERLDRLVREVLDLSRIEGGSLRPNLEPLDVGDAIRPVIDRFRSALGGRAITIDIPDELAPVRADAVLLDAILANLIENVVRHTPPEAQLAISARADATQVTIDVDDGGPGVPDEARGRMFTKFQARPGPSATSRPGLGIGLAIVRGMAEAMGAGVLAERSPLGGLRMRLLLPRAADPDDSVQPRADPTAAGAARAR